MKNFFNFSGKKSQSVPATVPATTVINIKPAITFPDSVQKDLWAAMTPQQQGIVQPVFRRLKKQTQEVLASALLDYVTTGRDSRFNDVVLGGVYLYLKSYFAPASVNPVNND